ncbi:MULTISPECIES: omptin family outer membrane protease [unclassified Treponema]|uniref:omptin family outer membrane protease n=2 Tax=Treponema TaxID=157 RepID=UPI0025F994A9|nr:MULTISPECIES: omptin family outer membrane protease [unclassified Treponema]
MHAFKKTSYVLLYITFFLMPICAQKKESFIKIEPYAGFANGVLEETLYYSSPSDKKISLLEWERKLFIYGAELKTAFKNFNLNADFETAPQNVNSGQMRDSDWLNPNDYSMKTTYSQGTNFSKKYYSTEVSFFYDIKAAKDFTVSPVLSAEYSCDSFYRKKGAEGWYSEDCRHWWHDSSSKHYPYYNPETGKTSKLAQIDYLRHTFFSWTGIKFRLRPEQKIEFALSLFASPVSYFYSIDTHYAQDKSTKIMYKKRYRQRQISYFNSIKINLDTALSLSKRFDLNLGLETLFNIKNGRGDLYSDYHSGSYQGEYIDLGQKTSSTLKSIKAKIGCTVKLME